MSTRWIALAAGLVVSTAFVALAAGRSMEHGERAITEHPVTIPTTARTIRLSSSMPEPSSSARRLAGMLVEGTMPTRKMMAEVMSDTECTPDAQMVSHCRNEVRLQDGTKIVVRHPHDMRNVPCLAPGEQIMLVPSST